MNTLPVEKACLDAATEKCPCAAAVTGDCPVCNILNHGQSCDCSLNWAGMCIYQSYLTNGSQLSKTSNDKIEVLQKISEKDFLKLVCFIPSHLQNIQAFQFVKITTQNFNKTIAMSGVISKVVPEQNLISLIIMDTNYEIPLKYGPLVAKGTILELKPQGPALPELPWGKMQDVIVCVDGFWLGMVKSLIDELKAKGKTVKVIGPFSHKIVNQLLSTAADKVISFEKLTEIKELHYDTIISINTPALQKKLLSYVWQEKNRKTFICVNNDAT
ncbi:MAG: hypothetical protein VR72_06540 [Clostridiaceae bacterium BRH_c20a]|nr:MAG: hypothetical protein VR72_06540 [Clostridiaceae bacterium BRH_c20a]